MSRGRGRGKPSVFTPQLLGHLAYADIIKASESGHEFYPRTDVDDKGHPIYKDYDTAAPSPFERSVATRFDRMKRKMALESPFWKDIPAKSTLDPFEFKRKALPVDEDESGLPLVESATAYTMASLQDIKGFSVVDPDAKELTIAHEVVANTKGNKTSKRRQRADEDSDEDGGPSNGHPTTILLDNADAQLLPRFFLKLYPNLNGPDEGARDQSREEKLKAADDRKLKLFAAGEDEESGRMADEIDENTGSEGGEGELEEDENDEDDGEHDYGADHFDNGDGDDNDALEGGGDEANGADY